MQRVVCPATFRPVLLGLSLLTILSLQPSCKGKPKAAETTAEPSPAPAQDSTTSASSNVTISPDDALIKGVTDATKDFPELTATVKEGVVTISGSTSAERWKKVKMAVDALKPKKVDASGIIIK